MVVTIQWKASILDTIRERPAMYLGVKSLTALWHFLQGYEMARLRSEAEPLPELPQHFADWVGYRLHLSGNCDGFWHHAILSRVRDEALALDRFYELLDEFGRREAKVVARIRVDSREYTVRLRGEDGRFVDRIEQLPDSLRIVVYTEDPGFFLVADEDEHFFFDGCFINALDSWKVPSLNHRFNVVDEGIWNRLIDEDKRYRRNLKRKRARIQMKKCETSGEDKLHP